MDGVVLWGYWSSGLVGGGLGLWVVCWRCWVRHSLQLSPQLYILLADQIIQPNHPADLSRTGAGGTHKTKTNKEDEMRRDKKRKSARNPEGAGAKPTPATKKLVPYKEQG